MASFSYILMGQAYLDTTSTLADTWVTSLPGITHAKLSEVKELIPEQKPPQVFQLNLTERESLLLGSAWSLASATINGHVDDQGFFIQALVMLSLNDKGESYHSLAMKMKTLAMNL